MDFLSIDFNEFVKRDGELAIMLDEGDIESKLDALLSGQISKMRAGGAFKKKGVWQALSYPHTLNATKLWLCDGSETPRKTGAKLAGATDQAVTLWGGDVEMAFGFALRAYSFSKYLEKPKDVAKLSLVVDDEKQAAKAYEAMQARVDGVHMVRDLVHEPANVLTTEEFAKRIEGLSALGLDVEILDEAKLEKIGMRALLAVGQGSDAPSKVAIMRWNGGKGDPLLLVGKGVVFDTGGISIKPAAGMEDMTMDMGGAAVVTGTMATLAKRKAKANVIGIVGLVENMPSGNAQRPGDIVKSLKGDTIEVLNTDAEGRLVLADILWYGQEKFKPRAVIDLATLTGAIIVALGHENAGIFGSNQEFTDQLLASAKTENEGAWPMPMGEAYDALLKSDLADMGNIGGRWGGSITAAQFLKRFVKEDMPWIHIDIAGVALRTKPDAFAPKGASGWGVLTLDRLIAEHFES